MINVNDIVNWVPLEDGTMINFVNRNPRSITLEFNTSGPVKLYYIALDDNMVEQKPRFLAGFTGRETVKFVTPGAFGVTYSGDAATEVFMLSSDSSKIHRENLDEETYTTLYDQRMRDPDHEKIIQSINAKVQRRLDHMEAAYERMLAEREQQYAMERDEHANGGVTPPQSGDGKEPVSETPPSGEPEPVEGGAPPAGA